MTQKPNILWICTDQQRWDTLGCYGNVAVHSPNIAKIELVIRGDVRRAKLYYLRDLRGKAAKIKEKRETQPAS